MSEQLKFLKLDLEVLERTHGTLELDEGRLRAIVVHMTALESSLAAAEGRYKELNRKTGIELGELTDNLENVRHSLRTRNKQLDDTIARAEAAEVELERVKEHHADCEFCNAKEV